MSKIPRRIKIASTLTALSLLLAACSNTPPAQLSGGDIPEEIAMTEDSAAPAAPAADDGEPETVATSDSATPDSATSDSADSDSADSASDDIPDGTLPRTTDEGIYITAETSTFDFGEGDVATIDITGEHATGMSGVILPMEDLVSDAEVLNALRWGGSATTIVLLMETGPSVDFVRVTSIRGGVDQTRPNNDGLAVLAVLFEELSDLTVEAFDPNGNVVGSCDAESLLLTCTAS